MSDWIPKFVAFGRSTESVPEALVEWLSSVLMKGPAPRKKWFVMW
jgi:hypothetical protein